MEPSSTYSPFSTRYSQWKFLILYLNILLYTAPHKTTYLYVCMCITNICKPWTGTASGARTSMLQIQHHLSKGGNLTNCFKVHKYKHTQYIICMCMYVFFAKRISIHILSIYVNMFMEFELTVLCRFTYISTSSST